MFWTLLCDVSVPDRFSLSVTLVGVSPRESFHDSASDLTLTSFTVKLRRLPSFMVLVPLRRCVGKQTPAAP